MKVFNCRYIDSKHYTDRSTIHTRVLIGPWRVHVLSAWFDPTKLCKSCGLKK
jgi:hypothetical protein